MARALSRTTTLQHQRMLLTHVPRKKPTLKRVGLRGQVRVDQDHIKATSPCGNKHGGAQHIPVANMSYHRVTFSQDAYLLITPRDISCPRVSCQTMRTPTRPKATSTQRKRDTHLHTHTHTNLYNTAPAPLGPGLPREPPSNCMTYSADIDDPPGGDGRSSGVQAGASLPVKRDAVVPRLSARLAAAMLSASPVSASSGRNFSVAKDAAGPAGSARSASSASSAGAASV